MKSKATGCGSISTVFSSIVLLFVSSIIIIIIKIMMMMMIIIIIIIILIIVIIILRNLSEKKFLSSRECDFQKTYCLIIKPLGDLN